MIENKKMDQTNTQSSAILKELSDIKATLAVNTNETVNIKASLTEMRGDIKEIKTTGISRPEFNSIIETIRKQIPDEKDHEERIRALETKVWKFIGALVVIQIVVLPIVLFLFFKVIK